MRVRRHILSSRIVVGALVAGTLGALPVTIAPVAPVGAAPANAPLPGDPVALTYMPEGFVVNTQKATKIDSYLADLHQFGINRALLELPGFHSDGTVILSSTANTMLSLWVARAAAYNAANGTSIGVTAVFNGRLDQGLDLDDAATRANMEAGVVQVVELGVTSVQLDLEPYPTTSGYLTLLDELRAAFAGTATPVDLSVVAPTDLTTWTPAYLAEVSARVDEVDPAFYDSGFPNATAYEQWMDQGLAFYSASTAPTARIVPLLPSYKANKWHKLKVENMTTATVALGQALAAGDRIDGAGIWWWWGFFYGKGNHKFEAPDQATWQSTTRVLLGD
jgi:hypothetical protein